MAIKAKDLGIVGTIARFKPVHNGHAVMLITLCERAEHLYIGLGSCNRYNARNPFTAEETKEMINALLTPKFSNYSFIEVPDYDNGPKWKNHMINAFGKLDNFVVGNEDVQTLLKEEYNVIHTFSVVSEKKISHLSATMVRTAMAKGEPWEHFCPEPVVAYLKEKGLDKRFVKEFGLETIEYSKHEMH